MNVPNALTITRIVLTPVVLAAYMLNFPAHFLVATILYFIAGMTDFFDGKIARSKNLITNFGKFADPLADKMLTTAVYLALISNGYCNIWILFIILFREFGISSIRLVAAAQGVVIPANMWGKVKTFSMMIFTGCPARELPAAHAVECPALDHRHRHGHLRRHLHHRRRQGHRLFQVSRIPN